jgi:hypothetical protein
VRLPANPFAVNHVTQWLRCCKACALLASDSAPLVRPAERCVWCASTSESSADPAAVSRRAQLQWRTMSDSECARLRVAVRESVQQTGWLLHQNTLHSALTPQTARLATEPVDCAEVCFQYLDGRMSGSALWDVARVFLYGSVSLCELTFAPGSRASETPLCSSRTFCVPLFSHLLCTSP